jgi:hypothetical protein
MVYTFGAVQDDQFTDVTMDRMGNLYACGITYSTAYSSSDQDIVVFKFDPDTMSFQRPNGWSLVWGGSLTETATSIAADQDLFIYVSGFSNSEDSLSVGKFDMFVMQIQGSSGAIGWVKRLGGQNNDKAIGLTYFMGSLYIVGESDSTGWTSIKTDMIFIKMNPTN